MWGEYQQNDAKVSINDVWDFINSVFSQESKEEFFAFMRDGGLCFIITRVMLVQQVRLPKHDIVAIVACCGMMVKTLYIQYACVSSGSRGTPSYHTDVKNTKRFVFPEEEGKMTLDQWNGLERKGYQGIGLMRAILKLVNIYFQYRVEQDVKSPIILLHFNKTVNDGAIGTYWKKRMGYTSFKPRQIVKQKKVIAAVDELREAIKGLEGLGCIANNFDDENFECVYRSISNCKWCSTKAPISTSAVVEQWKKAHIQPESVRAS